MFSMTYATMEDKPHFVNQLVPQRSAGLGKQSFPTDELQSNSH